MSDIEDDDYGYADEDPYADNDDQPRDEPEYEEEAQYGQAQSDYGRLGFGRLGQGDPATQTALDRIQNELGRILNQSEYTGVRPDRIRAVQERVVDIPLPRLQMMHLPTLAFAMLYHTTYETVNVGNMKTYLRTLSHVSDVHAIDAVRYIRMLAKRS